MKTSHSRLPQSVAQSLGLAPSLVALLALIPTAAGAVEADWVFRGTLAGQADGGRDLGLDGARDQQRGYIDATPWVQLQFSEALSGRVRVRLFAPTDDVLLPGNDNNNLAASSKAFVGLREAWLDYRGLTDYPGESLRVGRQRIRQSDAAWWDQDIDAARWIFDTSLLQFQLGAARQFDSYRSDGADIPAVQQDRTYGFATASFEPSPGVRLGLRAVHARDDRGAPDVGSTLAPGDKRTRGDLSWFGSYIEHDAYVAEPTASLSYWGSANGLVGKQRRLASEPLTGTITADDKESVRAWAADGGLRLRLPTVIPVQLGVAYSQSSAGGGERSAGYTQTGLQSNYSRYTGTRTLMHRYGETFRAELGNLKASTAFVSMRHEAWDASLVFNHLERVRGSAPVTSDGLRVSPSTDNVTLGNGYDLVIARYFEGKAPVDRLEPGEDLGTSLRLRASMFDPGAAYGPAAKLDYRVTVEMTLWY